MNLNNIIIIIELTKYAQIEVISLPFFRTALMQRLVILIVFSVPLKMLD